MSPSFEIGDRVDINGDKATVKFVGRIKKVDETGKIARSEDGELWLGLEWDDVERGKHSGEGLFEVSVEGSASFVKATKVHRPLTLLETVEEKYRDMLVPTRESSHLLGAIFASTGNAAVPEDMFVSTAREHKVDIELVGRERAMNRYKNLHLLQAVSLDHSKAGKVGEIEETAEKLNALQELDLSHSLFSDWQEVEKLGDALPSLRALQLNRCRLVIPENLSLSPKMSLSGLRVLALNNTGLNFAQICRVCRRIPALEALHIAKNRLESLSTAGKELVTESLKAVEMIDLDDNSLHDWHEIRVLARLPKLKKLILSDNALKSIYGEEGDFPVLENLSLAGNLFDSWDITVPLLLFPNLKETKFSRTPVFESLASSAAHRMAIARLPTLRVLNRSEIRARDREEAERFYLSRFAAQWAAAKEGGEDEIKKFNAEHPTYAAIKDRLGEVEVYQGGESGPKAMRDELIGINFVSELSEKKHTKKLPPSTTVGAIKTLGARLFRLEPDSVSFRYYNEGAEHFPEPLDDDFRTLTYYGIVTGATVLVEAR